MMGQMGMDYMMGRMSLGYLEMGYLEMSLHKTLIDLAQTEKVTKIRLVEIILLFLEMVLGLPQLMDTKQIMSRI